LTEVLNPTSQIETGVLFTGHRSFELPERKERNKEIMKERGKKLKEERLS
jgi:hypothetical protein